MVLERDSNQENNAVFNGLSVSDQNVIEAVRRTAQEIKTTEKVATAYEKNIWKDDPDRKDT
jgi:hypothetical protein